MKYKVEYKKWDRKFVFDFQVYIVEAKSLKLRIRGFH